MNNIAIGSCGEDVAIRYLEMRGYRVIAKNFKCRLGEIDIIAEKRDEIIFVEVKTRTNNKFGMPSEAVGKKKALRIRKAAAVYLLCNKRQNAKIRFDIFEILLNQMEGAF